MTSRPTRVDTRWLSAMTAIPFVGDRVACRHLRLDAQVSRLLYKRGVQSVAMVAGNLCCAEISDGGAAPIDDFNNSPLLRVRGSARRRATIVMAITKCRILGCQ